MTTTNAWREANMHGTVQLHESGQWVLVYLDGRVHRDGRGSSVGWYLFGPAAAGVYMEPDTGSRALSLLVASRTADTYIAEYEKMRAGVAIREASDGPPP